MMINFYRLTIYSYIEKKLTKLKGDRLNYFLKKYKNLELIIIDKIVITS